MKTAMLIENSENVQMCPAICENLTSSSLNVLQLLIA